MISFVNHTVNTDTLFPFSFCTKMKILTWNINGIRASKISLKLLFDSLDADIICLQETKVTRDMLDEQTAVVEGYNSYFSFSRKRSGYSGVATYCKESVIPIKAEEGLSGTFTTDAHGSVGCYGNHLDFSTEELKSLDAEGRAVITQHRIRKSDGRVDLVALINVYVPRAADSEARRHYKLKFLALLQTRAEALVTSGSHVIVLGDINTTHKKQDHCDPNSEEFLKKPSRLWLNQFLWEKDQDPSLTVCEDTELYIGTTPHAKGGLFADAFRYFHPDEENAYTNWQTLTAARKTNYGKRLDYILTDVPLANECLTGCSILAQVDGSDHCPVIAELCCHGDPAEKCPPLCTKNMPEFLGKQQKLLTYFQKLPTKDSDDGSNSQNTSSSQESVNSQVSVDKEENKSSTSSGSEVSSSWNTKKRASETSKRNPCKKAKLGKKSDNNAKQGNLMTFFQKSSIVTKTCSPKAENVCVKDISNSEKNCIQNVEQNSSFMTKPSDTCHEKDEDLSFCSQSSESNDKLEVKSVDKSDLMSPVTLQTASEEFKITQPLQKSAAQAWKCLLGGPGKVPLCKGHKEPCILRTVKKEGPTKGKQFYTCARGEGLKSNPESRCDYFLWIDKKKQ